MPNSIYSRGPFLKMSKTVARIKQTVAGTRTCAQQCFYEIKVPIPYKENNCCHTVRLLTLIFNACVYCFLSSQVGWCCTLSKEINCCHTVRSRQCWHLWNSLELKNCIWVSLATQKLHLGLIWAIYSRGLCHRLGTFLYPCFDRIKNSYFIKNAPLSLSERKLPWWGLNCENF